MKKRTEEKEAQASLKPAAQIEPPVTEEPESNNKAWDLTRQLKSRMAAMQGGNSRKSMAK